MSDPHALAIVAAWRKIPRTERAAFAYDHPEFGEAMSHALAGSRYVYEEDS